jgi:hypothetical protein
MLPQQPGLLASDPVGGDADHHFRCTRHAHLDMITGPTPDSCHHWIASRSAQQTAWAIRAVMAARWCGPPPGGVDAAAQTQLSPGEEVPVSARSIRSKSWNPAVRAFACCAQVHLSVHWGIHQAWARSPEGLIPARRESATDPPGAKADQRGAPGQEARSKRMVAWEVCSAALVDNGLIGMALDSDRPHHSQPPGPPRIGIRDDRIHASRCRATAP